MDQAILSSSAALHGDGRNRAPLQSPGCQRARPDPQLAPRKERGGDARLPGQGRPSTRRRQRTELRDASITTYAADWIGGRPVRGGRGPDVLLSKPRRGLLDAQRATQRRSPEGWFVSETQH